MDRTGFSLLFVPGLTVGAIAVAFAFAFFAMRQGPIQRATKRGLFSLVTVLVLGAALAVYGVRAHYSPVYPHAEKPAAAAHR